MSHQILKVNVSLHLQSINQPQLCEQMLELMTRDDKDSLLIVTSTQRISISSKLLQIFSPLYRDMLRDIPSSDNNPVTLFLPDFEAVHVHHLLDLLTSGRIKDKDLPMGSAGDILNLAKSFKIDLRESDLMVSLEDINERPQPRIKVKNIKDLSSPVPRESLNKETTMESNGQDLHDGINVGDDHVQDDNGQDWQEGINGEEERDIQDDNEERGAFCLKIIRGDEKSLKIHEENESRKRPNVNNNDNEKLNLWNECSFCQRIICGGETSMKTHKELCVQRSRAYDCPKCSIPLIGHPSLVHHYVQKHSEGRPLFKCTVCDMRFHKHQGLKKHIRKVHVVKTVGHVTSNFNEEPPSFMYKTKPF